MLFELRTLLEKFISHWKFLDKAYYLKTPLSANSKLAYGKILSRDQSFTFNNKFYELRIHVNCSGESVKVIKTIHVNREKKRITVLKKLLREINSSLITSFSYLEIEE